MSDRNVSLISLPDFGVPLKKEHQRAILGSYESGFNSFSHVTDQFMTNQTAFDTSKDDKFGTYKSALGTNIDMAAAFRRHLSMPAKIRSSVDSVYSPVSARTPQQIQYRKNELDAPRAKNALAIQSNVIKDTGSRSTSRLFADATFKNKDETRSDISGKSGVGRFPRNPRRRRHPLRRIYESSDGDVTDYSTEYSRQRRRRSHSTSLNKYHHRVRYHNEIDQRNVPFYRRSGPLLRSMHRFPTFPVAEIHPHANAMPSNYPWPYPAGLEGSMLLPVPITQPGEAFQQNTLTPIASRSLLTCSKDFRGQFPNVYSGLCKGLIDVSRLIQHEVVIPIREEIALHKNAMRSRRAVTATVAEQLWRPLHGKFPDPAIAPKLVKKISEYFFDKIEIGIQQAEDERSFLQWLFRFDVENAIEIRVTTTLGVGYNSAIANIEGAANIRRKKGELLSLLNPDSLCIDMDLIVKALFLNGGQLKEINNDPFFIDRVQASENRLAASFINFY